MQITEINVHISILYMDAIAFLYFHPVVRKLCSRVCGVLTEYVLLPIYLDDFLRMQSRRLGNPDFAYWVVDKVPYYFSLFSLSKGTYEKGGISAPHTESLKTVGISRFSGEH